MKLLFRCSQHFCWVWIYIEPAHKSMLGIDISEEKKIFVAENFIYSLIDKDGKILHIY